MKPRTLILRTAGTNCDAELAHAFELAGATTQRVHLNALIAEPAMLDGFDLLGLPGGFSYGDDIAAGRIFANRLRHALYPALRAFILAGRPVIGICNGFQLLVKAGLLPGFELPEDAPPAQAATLADNANPRFVDRWVSLRAEPASRCIWTRGLDKLDLPIAHGEGRFVADEGVLDRLEAGGQVALRYAEHDNPNGSMRDIAGVCDPTGLVFGLMPHPERALQTTNLPDWTRGGSHAAGLRFFRNAVEHVHSRAQLSASL
jgi:phosphoribosylformylglycinamidine synthase